MAQRNLYLLSTILVAGLSNLIASAHGDSEGIPLQPKAEAPKPSIITGDHLDPTKWGQIDVFSKNVNGEWGIDITTRTANQVKFKRFRYPTSDPTQPQSYAADVLVIEAKNIGARARAFMQRRFYKAEAAPQRLGDIVANLDVRQSADATGFRASASVHRCQNLNCDTSTTLFDQSFGPALSAGTRYRLSMEFDGQQTFTFKIDDIAVVTFNQAPPAVTGASTGDIYVGTSIWGVDPIADPVEEGIIRARFDNLAIEGNRGQDFNDTNSDDVRQNTEVRIVDNGKLVFERFFYKEISDTRPSLSRSLRIDPLDPSIVHNSVKAEVRIKEIELFGEELTGQIGLSKRWYQSTSTKPGGGDVYSELSIVHDSTDDGTINDGRVQLAIYKCNSVDCEGRDQEEIFLDDLTFGPVKLNTPHTLSMNWDGNAIVFGFDNQLHSESVTQIAPVVSERPLFLSLTPLISIRVGALKNPLERMSITAEVDDVFIDGELYDDFSTITDPPSTKLPTSGRNTGGVAIQTIEPEIKP